MNAVTQNQLTELATFDRRESAVRGYIRSFPTVFAHAKGSLLTSRSGREYIDFFAGAGALNYGHNPPELKTALLDYLSGDGITHSLDMATEAKEELLLALEKYVLEPRGLDYRVQFPGPTGTNAVEAALKLARKVTGRHKVLFFTNAFHGMTLGSLAVTGNGFKRQGAGTTLDLGVCMPFCGYLGDEADTLAYMRRLLEDSGSGVDRPAAVILETVQAEGGVNVASVPWLRMLAEQCRELEILLIVDDIQVGCGRTGPFFSFERAGITPDIVCLSKSISGYGLPLSLTLIRADLDCWDPGEHNGTFRGHNPAFVTATAALKHFWSDTTLAGAVRSKAQLSRSVLEHEAQRYPEFFEPPRGLGLIQGLPCRDPALAEAICRTAFARGLIMETAGPQDEVLKLLPALTIPPALLEQGLEILVGAIKSVVADTAVPANVELARMQQ